MDLGPSLPAHLARAPIILSTRLFCSQSQDSIWLMPYVPGQEEKYFNSIVHF